MLLLHSIIVLGALLVSSRARSNPYNIAARPDQEESNDNQLISETSGVEGLPREMDDTKVCQNEECRRTAQEILRNLNKSVDPCEDFYEYACGGWSQHNRIPANDDIWNQLKKIERRNKKRIREILEEPEEDTDTAAVKAAKRFHQSCMDLDAIEKLGLKPLEQVLEANGGWPMIMERSEWNSRNVSWKKIHENYQLLSRSASLFTVTVDADLDRNINAIKLNAGSSVIRYKMLIHPEEAPNERSYYAKYVEYVALTFAKSRNSNVSRKQISKDVADMIHFERYLYQLGYYSQSDEYLFWSAIHNVQKAYNEALPRSGKSKINWLKTFQNLFGDVGIHVKETDQILLSEYRFLKELAGLLERTPKRTIVNYLHWKFVSAMMPYTNKRMRNMNYSLNKFIFGVTKQKPRWEECISENPLKDAVAYQIVYKYLPKKSKEKVLDMVKEIQDQVEINISNMYWRSAKDKSQLRKKFRNASKFIGFPDWFSNASANIEFYKDLRVGPSYFDNILNYNKFALRKNLGKLRQPIDNTWLVDPLKANVYLDFIKIFPATSHQLPLFVASRPNAVNYGALGTIIGHEIFKPFDDLDYELYGNRCYVDQWNNYKKIEFETLNVTGYEDFDILYRGTIVDNAGLQAAYEAYQRKLAAEGITEDKLPGLENFSSQQMFFLSFANNWCESSELEKPFNNDLTSHEISVGRLTVIGSVSNTLQFSKAFQCPEGSPMNLKYKCTLWDW